LLGKKQATAILPPGKYQLIAALHLTFLLWVDLLL